MRRIPKEEGKYGEWVTCREGRAIVKRSEWPSFSRGNWGNQGGSEGSHGAASAGENQETRRRPREETIPDIRSRYEALVRERQRHNHWEARGEQAQCDNTDRDAATLAKGAG